MDGTYFIVSDVKIYYKYNNQFESVILFTIMWQKFNNFMGIRINNIVRFIKCNTKNVLDPGDFGQRMIFLVRYINCTFRTKVRYTFVIYLNGSEHFRPFVRNPVVCAACDHEQAVSCSYKCIAISVYNKLIYFFMYVFL